MRVIKPARVREFRMKHRRAEPSLEEWLTKMQAAEWANLVELRETFPSADPVKVASGKTVVVFNIAGNRYRLIAAVHYNTGRVFVLRFLTHAEYDKEAWKNQL